MSSSCYDRAQALFANLLEAQHTADAIGKALRLPYRAIPLQPIADMRQLVGEMLDEQRRLMGRIAALEARLAETGAFATH